MILELESDMTVIGEVGTGAASLVTAMLMRPDVVLMDIEMPDMDGLQAAESLRMLLPGVAVVMLTIYDNEAMRAKAAQAGAASFVGKHEPSDALLAAIRRSAAQAKSGSRSDFRPSDDPPYSA